MRAAQLLAALAFGIAQNGAEMTGTQQAAGSQPARTRPTHTHVAAAGRFAATQFSERREATSCTIGPGAPAVCRAVSFRRLAAATCDGKFFFFAELSTL